MDNLYKIKPLEWTEERDGDADWVAHTPLGDYWVDHSVLCTIWLYRPEMSGGYCTSVEEGKAAAEAHWRERILPMLEEVE